jgi:hypothetical protein
MALKAFCEWLAATSLSQTVQNVLWVIPLVQSLHILAIAVLIAAIVTIDLRLVGLNRDGPTLAGLSRRFMPWFWTALAMLLATGAVLVIGEPARELLNWLFYTKLVLVLLLMALTAFFQRRIAGDGAAFDATAAARIAGRMLGGFSLIIVTSVIIAGRWIAYVAV